MRDPGSGARRRANRDVWQAGLRGQLRRRENAALLGVAVGLADRCGRAEIRRVARRACRRLVYYESLWSNRQAWRPFVVQGQPELEAALRRGKGVILAPSHFGPYRWLAPALIERGLKVTLLVDRPTQGTVDRDVAGFGDQLYPNLDWTRFETVSSDDPTVLWKLATALRRGRVVLMFADGNAGAEGKAAPKGALRLTFLGQTIHVRPGIAALAATTGASLLPVFTYERRHGAAPPLMRIDPPIVRGDESKAEYRERAMQVLYRSLEREILAAPDRWEEWWLLPHWLADGPRVARVRQPQARTTQLTLPGLVGRQLRLVDTSVWPIMVDAQTEVLDLSTGASWGHDPLVIDLLESAERRTSARAWLERQDRREAARVALDGLVRAGVIGLHRDVAC